jgi:hypothetical protein
MKVMGRLVGRYSKQQHSIEKIVFLATIGGHPFRQFSPSRSFGITRRHALTA